METIEEYSKGKKKDWTMKLKLRCFKPTTAREVSEILIDSLKHNFASGKVLVTKP